MFILGNIRRAMERRIKRMRSILKLLLPVCIMTFLTGCGAESTAEEPGAMEESEKTSAEIQDTEDPAKTSAEIPDTDNPMPQSQTHDEAYSLDTEIAEVTADPVFGDYGRLIFPVDGWYYSGNTLGNLSLTWYNNIDPDKTVEIANYLRDHAEAGDTVSYDIYSEEEKAADPDKEDTGLSLSTRRSWRWIRTAIPCGEGARGQGWPRIWAAMARQPSTGMTFPRPEP